MYRGLHSSVQSCGLLGLAYIGLVFIYWINLRINQSTYHERLRDLCNINVIVVFVVF